jgi:hypothetical protein
VDFRNKSGNDKRVVRGVNVRIKISIILLLIPCIAILFWLGSIIKSEIITSKYSEKLIHEELQTNMLYDADDLKVLDYSDRYARVYYAYDSSGGAVIEFSNKDGKWALVFLGFL